jgi:hypothetical protein
MRNMPGVWWWKVLALLVMLMPLWFLSDIRGDVVAAQRQNLNVIPWDIQFDAPPARDTPHLGDAEALLREAHRLLLLGQRAQALGVAQALVTQYPNFQLGQLLFADLLSLASTQPGQAQAGLPLASPGTVRKLQQLNDEARLRLARPESTVYSGKEPAGLVYLSQKVPFAVVVNAAHSRLYVMAHSAADDAEKSGKGLKVIFETYMSVGQRGVGKQQKGDGKTPLGVYFIQKSYPGHVLPDLYGAGALTLNYPNDLDVLDGKTGSGIWLHGSPSEEFARAPEASDGCVVLSNPDMAFLMRLQLPAGTPVLIQRQIEWVDPQKNQNLRAQLWPALRSDSPQTSGEVLALLSWQGEGRKMMAAVSGSDHKAFASAAWVKSDYWIEQEQQWRAISAKVDDGPGADRPPGVLRSSKRRAPIEISQWQVQRAFD